MEKSKLSFFKGFILKNPLPKVICLLLAIVSWFIVMDYENPTVTRTFKDLEFKIIGQEDLNKRGLIIQKVDVKNVDIEVKGSWSNVMQLDSENINSYIDVSGYGVWKTLIPITAKSSDGAVSIKSKAPSKVEVTFDKIATVEKSVKIVTRGSLKDDFELGNLDSYNKKIKVKGPLSIIKNIAFLEAEINLDGKEKSFVENIKLIPKDSDGNIIENAEIETPILDVYIPIFIERDVKIRVNTKGNINSDYKISSINVEPSVVKIRGDSDKIAKIDVINTEEIDINNLRSSLEKEVKLKIDKDVQLLKKDKTIVAIELKPKEIKRITVPSSEVIIKGKSDKHTYSIDSSFEDISVDLIDIRDNILKIRKSDIKLEVDVANLKSGKYKLPLLLNKSEDNKLNIEHRINPKQIIMIIK